MKSNLMEELIKNTEVEFDGRLNIPDPDKKITAIKSDKTTVAGYLMMKSRFFVCLVNLKLWSSLHPS